ncbi:hypothetical protein ADL26_09880 [Thermoactinomyces vulgaris]|jgi:hypothetical protein|uniref:Uncharacterized protein n=1 Tax=Laceyella sediminis TaxID=573074 RepID=A0ABX5ET52_9BACL|nr:hypothetical protein [Laceyella sediminis]KPC74734.1 hypothetical protein ADL26_09880 [Thermoactinomyces vulgaris]PRZ17133.1 hypothetical protein CLV36_101229 [Laceyella sediminis]
MRDRERNGLKVDGARQSVTASPTKLPSLGARSLKQAFVIKEILDRPRALRPHRRFGLFR